MSGSPPARLGASFSIGFLSGLGGRVAYALLALPASILVSRLLGPQGKGSLDLATLIPFLVVLVAHLGLGSAGSYLISSKRFSPGEVLGTLTWVWVLLSLILTPAYLLTAALGGLARLAPGVETGLLILGGLAIPLHLGRQYLSSVLLGGQRYVIHSSVQVIQALLYLLGLTVFVALLSLGARGGVIAAILAGAAAVAYLGFVLHGTWGGRPIWRCDVIREAFRYGLRGQAGDLLQYFNYRLDVLVLAVLQGPREVGLYTLSVSLAELLWYIPNASALVVFPRTAAARDEARTFTPLVFRATSVMTLGAALLIAPVAGPLIPLVFGPSFAESALPFYLLLPGVVCLGGAKILSADLNGRGLPGYNAIGSFITLSVTLVLDLLLIPAHGATGAAVASSVAYITSFLYTTIVWVRVAGTPASTLVTFHRSDLGAARKALERLRRLGRMPAGDQNS